MREISNEDVYAALVAVLSKQIDAEKKAKGTTRVGGDYTNEAVELIERTKQHLRHS